MNRVREAVHAGEAYRHNLYGKHVTAAVLDTGICASHPDFDNRILAFEDILNHRRTPYDDCSHGTHVSSILCGSGLMSGGKFMGIAPGCRLVHVKVLDRRGNGSKEDVLRGIDWVIANRQRYGIRIMNISVGTVRESRQRDLELVHAVEKAWDAGIVVVVAAGNMGPEPMSITVPGNSRKVITVGSMDDCTEAAARSGNPMCYSGTGPTSECVCKPDIVAPGSSVIACSSEPDKIPRQAYCRKSGTSMATPVVSGAIAILLSLYPDMTNVEVKIRLRETAVDLQLQQRRQGWGALDIGRLLKLPREQNWK